MKIAATIVTYHPEPQHLEVLIKRLRKQVREIIVIDNSPHYAQIGHPDVYQNLPDNPGLAFAQNLAINKAIQGGATHILMLDQDSLPAPGMVAELLEVFDDNASPVAAVGPVYTNKFNGNESGFMTLGYLANTRYVPEVLEPNAADCTLRVDCDFLISSGTLFSVEALCQIGAMDESLFIDYIDTDWMLRAKACGYKIYGAPNARMEHTLGEDCKRLWFGRWRTVPVHRAFRYYYIFRNSLLVQKKQYATAKWRWFELKRMVSMLGFLLLCSDRTEKLGFALRGIGDGLRGRSGPLAQGFSHAG